MKEVYIRIRERARKIVASYPLQPFYQEHADAIELSRNLFETDPVIKKIRKFVANNIQHNMGHGLDHATKVTLDSGALMLIEGELAGYHEQNRRRFAFLTQCAGLLHDIKRSQDRHAEKGANYVRETFGSWNSFRADEVHCIACAIHNHEAFTKQRPSKNPESALVSDCLYDADKFRWGPDNFMHTVWDMIEFANVPFHKFVRHYPKGMLALKKIKNSFRTKTGMKYGPQFIETGLAIGEELYQVIQRDFSELLLP